MEFVATIIARVVVDVITVAILMLIGIRARFTWKREDACFGLLPRVSYHRYDGQARHAFTQWIAVRRHWSSRLWYLTIRHHQVTFDFRGNWLKEMPDPNDSRRDFAAEYRKRMREGRRT